MYKDVVGFWTAIAVIAILVVSIVIFVCYNREQTLPEAPAIRTGTNITVNVSTLTNIAISIQIR